MIKTGKRKAQHIQYAHLLLGSDESEDRVATHKSELSHRFNVSERMVERVRKSFCEMGMALFDKNEGRTRSDKKLDARVEAHLIALCCGPAPEGEPRWKLQMLADELVRLEVVESISAMSVCSLLKKTNSSLFKKNSM
jgi:transposase